MKKALLLFAAAGVIAATAYGQEAAPGALFTQSAKPMENIVPRTGSVVMPTLQRSSSTGTERTTSTVGRWYDYTYYWHNDYAPFKMYLDSLAGASIGGDVLGLNSALPLWKDTADYLGYSNGAGGYVYDYNPFTTAGMTLDPQAPVWNRADSFAGDLAITPTNAYTIDSVQVIGWYNRSYANAYKISVVDTLVIAFVQGNSTDSARSGRGDLPVYHFSDGSAYGITGTLPFVCMMHDSINNRAGHYVSGDTISAPPLTYTGTSSGPVYKILLTSSDTNNSNGTSGTTYPRPDRADVPISYAVTAGNQVGVSISFISGDTNFHAVHAPRGGTTIGDTLRFINSTGSTITGYKYGTYEIGYAYNSSDGTAANAVYAPFMTLYNGDWTDGFFKREGPGNYRDGGWGGFYETLWSWGGGTSLQYPEINFHVECTGCVTTGTHSLGVNNIASANVVRAYPDPAIRQLNIGYTLANSSEVTVTLSNMLGQVVASQKMANATSGTVEFKTLSLPNGVYLYNFESTGGRSSGRVVVAH